MNYDAAGADAREPHMSEVLVCEPVFFIKERHHEVIQMASGKPSAHRSVTGKKELKVRKY